MTTETMETREQYLEKMLTGGKACLPAIREMTIWGSSAAQLQRWHGLVRSYLFVCFIVGRPYKSG
ncbi:MAG: hypothetical protein R2941_02120 [Desulfobacterales bacterium]